MKNFLKNKVIVIIIVIVLSVTYFSVNKAIKKHNVIENDSLDIEENLNKENNFDKTELGKEQEEERVNDSEDEENKEDDEVENKILVYVTGEINNPGVIMLNENSRIIDAINSAGGTTNNADVSKINLAYVLKDGMKVNIPNKEDLKKDSNFEYITMDSGDGKNDDLLKSDDNLSNKTEKSSTNKSKVNINTATQTELETLPGIGPSTALKIINYRNENGKFSTIEEIKNVSGIGDSKFENIKKYITV